MNEGTDYLILLYDSSSDDSYTLTSIKQIEKVASRFFDLNIRSVKFGAFDMRAEAPPVELKLYGKLPQMMFFPAFSKKPPFKRPVELQAKLLMEWIKKNSDIKFDLPKYAHLTEGEFRVLESGGVIEDL